MRGEHPPKRPPVVVKLPCRELMLEYGVVKMVGNIVTQIIQGAYGGCTQPICAWMGPGLGLVWGRRKCGHQTVQPWPARY